MSSMPTPDARAVVRVLDALLTQVKRIADHTATGSFALAPPPVVDTDDTPTTPDFTPWPGITADAVKAMAPIPRPAELVEDERVFREREAQIDEQARVDSRAQHGQPAQPFASEQAYRWARREPLLDLLTRLQRGRTPTADEARTLRHLVETEMAEADTARAEAKRLGLMVDEYSAGARQLSESLRMEKGRAEIAVTELRVLRAGLRANGADPTQIQNLWAQIRLRNRQWRDATREVRLTRNLLEQGEVDTDLIDEMIATVDSAHDKLHEAQAEAEQLRALLATENARANAAIDRETTAEEAAEQAADERDGAYRERAHLVALLAALMPSAVLAPATDIEEPGWTIAYLTIGGRQASWHISPRDADLAAHIEAVEPDDPRARWDGHTTEEKYAAIAEYTAALTVQTTTEGN